MICFPLDNQTYTAKALGAYLGTRTRGVFCAEDNLLVTANGDYTLTVHPGLCWFSAGAYWGACGLVETPTVLSLAPADGELSRIDAICARLDKNRNLAEVAVKQGAYHLNPVAPAPQRDTECDELVLATVRVPAGATGVAAGNLTDTRLDEGLCGLMRDGVTAIPTAQLQAEYRGMLALLKAELEGVRDETAFLLKSDYATDQATAVMSGGKLTITSLYPRPGTSYDVRFTLPAGYTAASTAVIDGTAVSITSPRTLQPVALDAAAGAACRLSRDDGRAYIQADPRPVDNTSPYFRRVFFATTASWPAGAADGDLLAVYT